jgi:uncharacterized protein YodC (DUF2158 family)
MVKFKLCDVVQLKSGGPLMTIFLIEEVGHRDAFGNINDVDRYYCEWFEFDEWLGRQKHVSRGFTGNVLVKKEI